MSGDLTTAFDFKTPNTRRITLPNTDALKPEDLVRHNDEVPVPPVHESLPGHWRRRLRICRSTARMASSDPSLAAQAGSGRSSKSE